MREHDLFEVVGDDVPKNGLCATHYDEVADHVVTDVVSVLEQHFRAVCVEPLGRERVRETELAVKPVESWSDPLKGHPA